MSRTTVSPATTNGWLSAARHWGGLNTQPPKDSRQKLRLELKQQPFGCLNPLLQQPQKADAFRPRPSTRRWSQDRSPYTSEPDDSFTRYDQRLAVGRKALGRIEHAAAQDSQQKLRLEFKQQPFGGLNPLLQQPQKADAFRPRPATRRWSQDRSPYTSEPG